MSTPGPDHPESTTPPPAPELGGLDPQDLLQAGLDTVPAMTSPPQPPDPDVTMPVSRPQSTQPSPAQPELPMPDELTALLPGGNYQVEKFLGQGGMGAVYKGTQVRLKRPVAIKIMRRDFGKDYDFEARFEREAQAMAKLNHPNIVSVIDFGEAGPDYLYIVMELVDGADMMDVIRTGRMTQEMALTLLPQICDALQFAHDHGIVHRDIKPSNIMLTRDGRIKMADFGLAKRFDTESSFRTQTGTGMGTPDYAAPEQFDANAPIDHRADIYALGVMIYQMITGALPRGVWKPPSQRAEINPQWDDIVSRAMQSDPKDRYQQASEVKTDVSSIPLAQGRAAGPPAAANGPARTNPEKAPARPNAALAGASALPKAKSRAALAIGTVVIGLIAFAAVMFATRGKQSSAGLEPAPASPAPIASKPAQAATTPAAKANGDGLKPGTTLAAATPAAASSPKQTLDLIALVDVQRDRMKAEGNAGANVWTKSGGQLVFTSGDKRAGKISAPVALNGLRDYEIEVGVPTPGTDAIGIDLPIFATNQATIAFVPGEIVVLRDGNTSKPIGNWPKDASSPPWKLATRVKIDADGINGTIAATVNGTAVGEWRGALGKLGKTTEMHPDFPGQLVPALYIRSGDRTHSSWTLRTYDGEAKVLRGAVAAPAHSPADSPASSPIIERWVRMWNLAEQHDGQSPFTVEDGWVVRRSDATSDRRILPEQWHDGAIRGEFRWTPGKKIGGLWLRAKAEHSSNSQMYALTRSKKGVVLTYSNRADESGAEVLKEYKAAQPKEGDTYTLELRAVGKTLVAKLDDKEIIRVDDDRLTAGSPGIILFGPGAMRNIEMLNLDGAEGRAAGPPAAATGPASSNPGIPPATPSAALAGASALPIAASPATATKDSSFINTLGMKFVPVPITGGPTAKQRVLFSVWETRVQDYEVFAKETKREWAKPAFAQGPTHPAVNVSWQDASAFCVWLTEKEHKAGNLKAKDAFRLPSDHEWSCANGIGDNEDAFMPPSKKSRQSAERFSWGTAWPPPNGTENLSGSEAIEHKTWEGQKFIEGYHDDFATTAPAGSFPAAPNGLFDLGGNVREWSADDFDASQGTKTWRGASFRDGVRSTLSLNYRSGLSSSNRDAMLGFRVVLAVASEKAAAWQPAYEPVASLVAKKSSRKQEGEWLVLSGSDSIGNTQVKYEKGIFRLKAQLASEGGTLKVGSSFGEIEIDHTSKHTSLNLWKLGPLPNPPRIKHTEPLPKDRVVELMCARVGNSAFGWLDGNLIGTRGAEGEQKAGSPFVAFEGKEGVVKLTAIEVMVLDDVPESQWPEFLRTAMKAAPPSPPPSATAAVSPAPNLPVSKSSDPKFPPGQWVKLFTKPEDLPADLRKPDSGVRWEDGWIRGGPPERKLILPATLKANYGLRATFKRSTGSFARLCLRHDFKGLQPYYQFGIGSSEKLIMQAISAEQRQGVWSIDIPKIADGSNYRLEFAAVGNLSIARYGDIIKTMDIKDAPQGGAQITGLEDVRDIEVINLDGLPEAEALRLLGVDEQGNDLRGKTK
ncbi:MAG: protein kinase [Verrucomicrobiaceae bacterium]|nr:protein kinase [Verrucomicrobiaceae bacterium]